MIQYSAEVTATVDKLYNLEETSEYLHCTVRTVRNWIKEGKLKAVKIGKRLLIEQSELESFVKSHKEQGG
jgi:excisionase family DNA binding protein